MKLVKIFGVVMGVHAAVFVCIFAVPGCRSTGKKPVAAAPVTGAATDSPVAGTEGNSPVGGTTEAPAAEVSAVRFSPTRPGSPIAVEATAPAATAPATYSVAKGDNLWTIAKKNGVTVKQLTSANNLRADSRLSLGQKLVIPGKSTAPAAAPAVAEVKSLVPAAAAPAAAPTPANVHVVKAGESLGTIAKKYQVKVGDIATANNIADPTKLRVGQSLKIPGGHSSAAKPVTSTVKPVSTIAKPAPKTAAPTPVQAPAPVKAPSAAPVFTSPLLETAPAAGESPLITPAATATDAPVIRVEESTAPMAQ